jgi:hypothetical protein
MLSNMPADMVICLVGINISEKPAYYNVSFSLLHLLPSKEHALYTATWKADNFQQGK